MHMQKVAVLAFSGLLVGASAAQSATEHDNDVFFAIAGVEDFDFQEEAHSITDGQPYSGTSSEVSDPGAEGKITVKAGRKGSEDVAEWFKDQVGAGQTVVCDSSGTFPDKLNFAVEGTLKMTVGDNKVTCNDVLVAQGHFGANNNWWMGGPHMNGAHVSISGATAQFCSVEDSPLPALVVFSPQTPCVNHFNISVNTLDK